MRIQLRGISPVLFALMALGTLCGLIAAVMRFSAEMHNRRVEIGLEWQEVSTLAQSLGKTPKETLEALDNNHSNHISTLILQEDTITQLEQSGAIQTQSTPAENGRWLTTVTAYPETLERIRKALELHEIPINPPSQTPTFAGTIFTSREAGLLSNDLYVPVDYAQLRTMGVGLPPDGIAAARDAKLRIAARIGNFPGVTQSAAEKILRNLREQMAPQGEDPPMVIFSGEETLGYRDMEKWVAAMLRDPKAPLSPGLLALEKQEEKEGRTLPEPVGLTYGAVEFSKQKGDEKLSAVLNGDFVRVHSIQAAEMGQMTEEEAVERFALAARERNIRFCYVRLLTFAGADRLKDNRGYLDKIIKGMEKNGYVTGQLGFASQMKGAKRYTDIHVSRILFLLLGLGVAAGTVWMLVLFCPLSELMQWRLLVVLGLVCAVLGIWGDTGHKLLALLAGIVYPAAACLYTFPLPKNRTSQIAPASLSRCIAMSVRLLTVASLITGIGIVHVIGLLAARPFMVHAEQFVGIKAQHAIPLFIVLLAAMMGGAALEKERWEDYKARAVRGFRNALSEPARFGTLILFIVAVAALALVVARTGNDAGVGVSSFELKARALLDTILPVRPRTKEFLVGHPLFILGIAWWLRGRRTLALPCFVAGSLGQVSLLNTFCHIHTPLLSSFWRDLLGLIFGAAIGLAVFWGVERVTPPPNLLPERTTEAEP